MTASDGSASADGSGASLDPGTDRAQRRTARWLVIAQFVLLGVLVVLPGRTDWPVPRGLAVASTVGVAVGLALMVLAGTSLGRGLTATPMPNAHAQLRTGGLYRFVRHPIYTGLLLLAAAVTAPSGSVFRLVVLGLLVALLSMKARWEESRLAERFAGYPAYAAVTPRFVPLRLRLGNGAVTAVVEADESPSDADEAVEPGTAERPDAAVDDHAA